MKKILLILILIFLFLPGCRMISRKMRKEGKTKGMLDTKYPIILVHGLMLRDDNKDLEYWYEIPKELEKFGIKVFLSKQNAWDSVEKNANIIKNQINKICNEERVKKVNIIAHSKGGIESRYLISKLKMENKVASLTTLATPHRGSSLADIIMGKIKDKDENLPKIVDFFAKITGDKNPDSYEAVRCLTSEYMKDFNKKVKNSDKVYYQSYGGQITGIVADGILQTTNIIMKKYEGENDGMVSIESSKWGDFKGVITGDEPFGGVTHFYFVNHFMGLTPGYNAKLFIVDIIKDLKENGY